MKGGAVRWGVSEAGAVKALGAHFYYWFLCTILVVVTGKTNSYIQLRPPTYLWCTFHFIWSNNSTYLGTISVLIIICTYHIFFLPPSFSTAPKTQHWHHDVELHSSRENVRHTIHNEEKKWKMHWQPNQLPAPGSLICSVFSLLWGDRIEDAWIDHIFSW
jgi:hypothetical protein